MLIVFIMYTYQMHYIAALLSAPEYYGTFSIYFQSLTHGMICCVILFIFLLRLVDPGFVDEKLEEEIFEVNVSKSLRPCPGNPAVFKGPLILI